MSNAGIDKKHLPAVRWDILRTLRVGGHKGATEGMIREVVLEGWMLSTQKLIRDELHYLEARGLIEIEKSELLQWRCKLTRYGYDLADYQVECEDGIRRPPYHDS